MSTFLVSVGVVLAAIVAVVYVVLNGPDQPATIRRQPSRAKPRRRRRPVAPAEAAVEPVAVAPARAPVAMPVAATPAFAGPDSDIMRLRVLPARRTTLWVRVRSGVALVILVAILGALVALAVGAMAVGLAFLVRSATG